jgi:dienelactone hydrolase
VGLLGCRTSGTESSSDRGATSSVTEIAAPAGTESLAVRWVKVVTPHEGTLLAAVAMPERSGPFPAVLILHGTHGFAAEYVQLARALARRGFVGVAACWFSGGRGAGMRFITPIAWPDAPALSAASSDTAQHAVEALVRAVRELPGVRGDRIALFGHSRGGAAVLNYVLAPHAMSAVVLNSTGYPVEPVEGLEVVRTPILILHGTADDPSDGGSAFSNVARARAFESALRRANRRVEAEYYEGGGHNALFTSETQRQAEIDRMTKFFERYLFE